jgi:hypothetical protein
MEDSETLLRSILKRPDQPTARSRHPTRTLRRLVRFSPYLMAPNKRNRSTTGGSENAGASGSSRASKRVTKPTPKAAEAPPKPPTKSRPRGGASSASASAAKRKPKAAPPPPVPEPEPDPESEPEAGDKAEEEGGDDGQDEERGRRQSRLHACILFNTLHYNKHTLFNSPFSLQWPIYLFTYQNTSNTDSQHTVPISIYCRNSAA